MSKRVAIIQSNYIPWKGYFNIIQAVDEFVLLDDVQYTRRDWRNRNLIKTASGLKWLTIPVNVKGNYFISINEVQVADNSWREDHWNKIVSAYKKAPFFELYRPGFEELFLGNRHTNLSSINHSFIQAINTMLEIRTPIRWSTEFKASTDKSERLLDICKSLNATEYLSGPAARDYLDCSLFERNKIEVAWADYSGYPVYNQLYPPFEHGVSVIDLIFNEGPDAKKFLKSFN